MREEPFDFYRRNIPPEIIGGLPASVARECLVIPIRWDDGIVVAMADPFDRDTLDKLRFILNTHVTAVAATRGAIEYALARYYPA
jgi:type IV pilus assembly protein PilB